MDAFMINKLLGENYFGMNEKKPKNIDGIIILGWEIFGSNNNNLFHFD